MSQPKRLTQAAGTRAVPLSRQPIGLGRGQSGEA